MSKWPFCGPCPKGAVAYIVVSFISATFILKSCQPFLEDIMIGFTAIPVGLYFGVGHVLGGNFLPDQPVRIYGSAGVSGGGRRYLTGTVCSFPTDRTLFVCGCACRRFCCPLSALCRA